MPSPLQIVACLNDIAEELDIKVGVAVSLFDENFHPKPAYHAFKKAFISGMKKYA